MLDTLTIFNSNPELLDAKEKSGSGQFSDVYLTPCGEYAIKHGNYGFSDGWLLFAAKLLTIPEEDRPWWAPVVHSLRVDMETGKFTALVKAYEYNHDSPCTIGYVSELKEYLDSVKEDHAGELPEDGEYDEDDYDGLLLEAAFFGNSTVECIEFLYSLQEETKVPLYFDMMGNSMWDAGEERVVLNDPCVVKGWHTAKFDLIYRAKFRMFLTKCADSAPALSLKGYW